MAIKTPRQFEASLKKRERCFKETDTKLLEDSLAFIAQQRVKDNGAIHLDRLGHIRQLEKLFGESYADLLTYLETRKSSTPDYGEICPESAGWLYEYLKILRNVESPGVFLAASALSALSYAVGRSYWTHYLHMTTFPIFSTVLVGPSGSKKTSAINFALDLVEPWEILSGSDETFDPEDGPPDYDKRIIIRDKVTPERLLNSLRQPFHQREQVGFLVFGELATGLGRQAYQSGMIPLITRLMDNETVFEDNTLGRGRTRIYNTSLILLGGTTEDWLETEISASAVAGGTTSRIVFICSKPTRKIIPTIPQSTKDEIVTLGEQIMNTLKTRTAHFGGRMAWQKDALHLFQVAYAEFRLDTIQRDAAGTSATAGWAARKFDHIVRLALLLAVTNDHSKIEVSDLETAIHFIDYAEDSSRAVFRRLNTHPGYRLREDVLEAVRDGVSTIPSLVSNLSSYDPAELRSATVQLATEGILKLAGGRITIKEDE